MYHISDLKKFVRCPRFYFLANEQQRNLNKFLRIDESTIELLSRHLHIDNCFQGFQGDDANRFLHELNNYEWFIKVRLEDGDLRVKIPIMHRDDNNRFDVYFLYHSTSIKDLDLFYYRLNIEVLRKQGIDIDNVYLAYINGDYVFENQLAIDSLFNITDHYKGKRIVDLLDDEIDDYKDIIQRIEATSLDSYSPRKSRICRGRSLCPYYYNCFEEEEKLPCDSILTLVSSQHKEQMYKDGIVLLKDANIELVEGNRVQYAQIMASRNNGLFVDKFSLKSFLKKLDTRPMSFVDFEWDTYLVPQYNKMKPLDVIPFEFVLYVLDQNDEMHKYTFVGSGDCRKEFIEGFLKDLPNEGPILAYNAIGAECKRLQELGDYFTEYSSTISDIINRFVDLSIPFLDGIVYDTRLEGNFTLKRLVSVVSNIDYKDLDISDGMEAVYNWREIDKDEANPNEEEIVNKLIEYCSLDAYGLYLVYEWLKKLV